MKYKKLKKIGNKIIVEQTDLDEKRKTNEQESIDQKEDKEQYPSDQEERTKEQKPTESEHRKLSSQGEKTKQQKQVEQPSDQENTDQQKQAGKKEQPLTSKKEKKKTRKQPAAQKQKKKTNEQQSTAKDDQPTVENLLNLIDDNVDVKHLLFYENQLEMVYFSTLIDGKKLDDDILNPIASLDFQQAVQLLHKKNIDQAKTLKDLMDAVLAGAVAIFFQNQAYTFNIYGPEKRGIEKSEIESVIIGAHDAFVEDADTNISLIRRRIKSPKLKVISIPVGEVTKLKIYLIYIDQLANEELVNELKTRIGKIEVDSVLDTNMLAQLIDENPDSVFPQYYNTELPDVVRSKLLEGKIAILLEGSPIALTAPANFFEFIQSPDDYNERWLIGTSLRILRVLAIFITMTFTAFYVAMITFHYEVLPEDLLLTLAESRSRVPFPPVIEAILMEFTIELLREAGARLPSKVGQTIGVVGGIVIGQAAVQAGFTSNILIIVVAISAIASFVSPSYNMSNAVRIIRFSLIILAGFLGLFGIMFGLALTIIHLVGITSLKTPYFIPVSPLYASEWRDIFIRGPFSILVKRPVQSKTKNKVRNKQKQ